MARRDHGCHRAGRGRGGAAGVRGEPPGAARARPGSGLHPARPGTEYGHQHGRFPGASGGDGRGVERPAAGLEGDRPSRRHRPGAQHLGGMLRGAPAVLDGVPAGGSRRPSDLDPRHHRAAVGAELARDHVRRHRPGRDRGPAARDAGPLPEPGRADPGGHLPGRAGRRRHLRQPAGRGDAGRRPSPLDGRGLRGLAVGDPPGRPGNRRCPVPADAGRGWGVRCRVPGRPPRRRGPLGA